MRTERTVIADEKKRLPLICAAVAVIISVILYSGFVMMLGSTFGIGFKLNKVLFASLITALVFCTIFMFNRKWISFAALVASPVVFTLSVYYKWFNVKNGIMALLYYLKLYVFLWLPYDFPEDPEAEKNIFALIVAYGLIVISCTVFVILKRRMIPAALLFFAPMFVFSVANTDLSPKAAPCLTALAGVVMLLLCHAFRRKKQYTYEKVLIVLTVPVICIMFLLGSVFPQKNYNKDKLAQKIIIEARDWFDKTAGRDNRLRKLFDIALDGFENTDFDDSFDTVSPLYSTPTNLTKVGPFNPSSEEVLKVLRNSNPEYSGVMTPYSGNVLYLKVESSDTYQNNTLKNTNFRMKVYENGNRPEPEVAQYGITIKPLKSTSVDIVPYYTDHYSKNGVQNKNHNPYNFTREHVFSFASSPIPVKTGNIYSKQYLNNYVYKTCLEVPYSTDRALILGGNLPDWYLEVYYGRQEMTDAEKVKAVTEFVRGLHPYNVNTEYPPKGADFVPWFVNEGKSGICVHYAATSMVLLRMIGIPARYVRGYADVNSGADKESTVYASQAHAWFEFFVPEYGWIMGDATPGYNVNESYFNIEAVSNAHPEIDTDSFRQDETEETATGSTTNGTETSETAVETSASSESPVSETTTGPNGETQAASGGSSAEGTGAPDINKYKDPEPGLPEYIVRFLKMVLAAVIGVTVPAVIVLAGRAVLFIYWTNRFRAEKINDRAVAYYHYYNLMARIFRFVFPDEINEIAEKAVFSGKDISKKEYDTLVISCRKIMKAVSVDFSRPKMLLFRLMLMPEIKDA